MKKVDLIIDMQYGSTGKGLIAGYLAETNKYDTVINANMPNAGHTYVNSEGRTWIHKVLPNGIVSPNLKRVMIGPGSVFSPDRLKKEIEDSADILKDVQILIHPNAVPLTEEHVKRDQDACKRISGTGQGSGGALQEKVNRTALIASQSDDWFKIYVVNHQEWKDALIKSEKILAEGAQGFSLSVSEQFYPYCTSRDCTPARFLADMGIPVQMLNEVIGTVRTYPIRGGGASGSCYDDQIEINWSDIGLNPEYTTVTNRQRRIFTFSKKQMDDAAFAIQPNKVFLNFCNYVDEKTLTERINAIRESVSVFGGKIEYLGYGPSFTDIERVSL
ncbi:adenylosuccinate synthetase [Vibrio parahaemolyticus]|nr:adenylosuccinate synthetase [Vibrio parahaemolyticus]